MELFIALFGSIYYFLKYRQCKEEKRSSDAEFRRSHDNYNSLRSAWLFKVTNEALEAEIRDGLRHGDAGLISEAASSGLYFPMCPVFMFEPDIPDALRILMANRGYLTVADAKYGIRVFCRGNNAAGVSSQYERQKKFIMYLDGKLRERGICHDMFMHTASKYYNFPLERTPVPGGVTAVGEVVWRPMINPCFLQPGKGLYVY